MNNLGNYSLPPITVRKGTSWALTHLGIRIQQSWELAGLLGPLGSQRCLLVIFDSMTTTGLTSGAWLCTENTHLCVCVSLSHCPGREQYRAITADDATAKKNNLMEKIHVLLQNVYLNLQGSLTLMFNFILLTIRPSCAILHFDHVS